MFNKKISIICLLLLSVFVMFFNLGSVPLLDPDEPVYAESPKEMLAAGDLLSPKIYGYYWFDKPPMYYWLVAGSYKLFGINDFAARFPSALLGIVLIFTGYYFANKFFNEKVAMYSALILLTSVEFFYLSKAAVTDITLTLFLSVALFLFMQKKYYLFYIFAGLATLTKGPIGIIFPGFIILLYLLITRNFTEIKQMKIPTGFILFSIVAFPWYFYMYLTHGSIFIETFLGFHNITRFTSPEHPSGVLWYYYIPVLLIGFFPWSTIMVQALYKSLTKAKEKYNELLFLNIWVFFIFIFFSISQTKLVSYILPLFPPLAIITGWFLQQIQQNYYHKAKQVGWLSLNLVLNGLFIAALYFNINQLPGLEISVIIIASVLLLNLLINTSFIYKNKFNYAFVSNVIMMIVIIATLYGITFGAIAPQFASNNLAKEFINHYDQKSPIYVSKFLRPGFSFYSNYYGEELFFSKNNIPDIEALLTKQNQSYFVLRDIDYERIPEQTRQKLLLVKQVDNKFIYKYIKNGE